MKICDVCKRDDGHGPNALQEDHISTVKIGTDIQTARVGVQHESPLEIELCGSCIEKVNASISTHLAHTFGIRIRQ